VGEGRGERRSDKLARAGTEHQIHVRLAKCALMIVTSVAPAGFPALKRTRRSSCAALCATSLRSVTSITSELFSVTRPSPSGESLCGNQISWSRGPSQAGVVSTFLRWLSPFGARVA